MRPTFSRHHVPALTAAAVLAVLYVAAGLKYEGFWSWRVFVNLLQDNAFLGIAAVGETLVILSGGIDLSAGAMVALSGVVTAALIEGYGWPAWWAWAAACALGTAFGGAMGVMIAWFRAPAFLVTLAGMFLARGLALVIGPESVGIEDPAYARLATGGLGFFPPTALAFLMVLGAGAAMTRWTRFGRAAYAIGGSEVSAELMGLRVASVKTRLYALSGFCSALAGVVYTWYTASGNALAGYLLELDAIAAAVIGGTALAGGVGSIFGTLIGVLIFGVIQTAIAFEGTLNSWWTRIAVGGLLLAFILLQKAVSGRFGCERRAGESGV